MATPEERPKQGSSLAELAASVAAPIIAAREAMKAISDSPGAAPLHAFVRQGADEISQVLTAFPAQAVQPVAEMGQMFEPTPAQADREMTGKSLADLRDFATERAATASQAMEKTSQERDEGRTM